MQFCPRCKSILIPNQDSKRIVCGCGYILRQPKTIKLGEKTEKVKKVDIIDKTIETLPKTEVKCPKCNNGNELQIQGQVIQDLSKVNKQLYNKVKMLINQK